MGIHVWIILFIKATDSRIPRCSPLQNGLSFEFEKYPRRYKLPFCSQYKKSCCRPSDTQRIFNEIKPILQSDDISSKCRQLTTDIYCSSCDPGIGTKQMNGICINYCNEWYDACRNEYYYLDLVGKIKTCTVNSTVCSPLHTFIGNGTDFCRVSGFEINDIYLSCFDGKKKDRFNQKHKNPKLLKSKTNKPLFHGLLIRSQNRANKKSEIKRKEKSK